MQGNRVSKYHKQGGAARPPKVTSIESKRSELWLPREISAQSRQNGRFQPLDSHQKIPHDFGAGRHVVRVQQHHNIPLRSFTQEPFNRIPLCIPPMRFQPECRGKIQQTTILRRPQLRILKIAKKVLLHGLSAPGEISLRLIGRKVIPPQAKTPRSMLGERHHPAPHFLLETPKLLAECLSRTRILQMKAKLMPSCLHQFAHFRGRISALPEKYVGRFSIRTQNAENRLQLVEVTQPVHPRQPVVRAKAAGNMAYDSLFSVRAIHVNSHNQRHASFLLTLALAEVLLPASYAAATGTEAASSSTTMNTYSLSVSHLKFFANSALFRASAALFPGSA